ncbi:hypothetical protein MCOR25_005009 [Pyricularia grisea]|uniref:TPR domain-containing protein n=1 Tax=Pyricularia grisea TaxID=148305 RepID=A0A6P8B0H4_PYRGI|nr:uncharacterized protein PgNI_07734 [Pyricularia grisea]KAI6367087.1 hypothetical protein MCOR25_005009 [Pyricularia grisea]TLD08326.1 hypothetical protein PgNI_07734 [Pyricularia grisea]
MSASIRAMQLRKVAIRLLPEQGRTTNLLLRTNSCRHIVQKLGSFQLQQQLRLKSTFDPKSFEPGQQKSEDGEEKKIPKPSVGQIFSQAFKGAIQMLGGVFRSENLKKAWQTHPGEFSLAVIMLTGVAGVVGYTVYLYFNYFYAEQFTRYPDEVAFSLRKALYYGDYVKDPKLALKYYQKAIEQCFEHRLDFFSDEFVGVRVRLAQWLEETGAYDQAIHALEVILNDHKRWVDMMEQQIKEGKNPDQLLTATTATVIPAKDAEGQQSEQGREAAAQTTTNLAAAGSAADAKTTQGSHSAAIDDTTANGQPEAPRETIWGKRNRIIRRSIGIAVKLGQLYSDEHVLKQDLAHERLTWAVETLLREMQRRSTEGTKPGEYDFLSDEEVGGVFEQLGQSFLAKDKAHLAVPLFFQALNLCKAPCHTATLMNNLATAFAQHPITGDNIPQDLIKFSNKSSPEWWAATKATYLEFAKNWANNAVGLASSTKGEDVRTPECDQACAVALCNLGEIASLSGNPEEARKRFNQCIAMSNKLDFPEGVKQAKAGLKELTTGEKK